MSHDFILIGYSLTSLVTVHSTKWIAEHKNRHLLEVVRTLMIESYVSPPFWIESLSTVVYLINCLPSPTLHLDSSYSHLFGVAPNYNYLHAFGCVYFVHLPHIERHKLNA